MSVQHYQDNLNQIAGEIVTKQTEIDETKRVFDKPENLPVVKDALNESLIKLTNELDKLLQKEEEAKKDLAKAEAQAKAEEAKLEKRVAMMSGIQADLIKRDNIGIVARDETEIRITKDIGNKTYVISIKAEVVSTGRSYERQTVERTNICFPYQTRMKNRFCKKAATIIKAVEECWKTLESAHDSKVAAVKQEQDLAKAVQQFVPGAASKTEWKYSQYRNDGGYEISYVEIGPGRVTNYTPETELFQASFGGKVTGEQMKQIVAILESNRADK